MPSLDGHSDKIWRGCGEYTHVILSVVFECRTADLPQFNSFACFCIVILLKATVSSWQTVSGCCCWALPRFFVVVLVDLRRNANLAGGFAGRCRCFWLCFVQETDLPLMGHTGPFHSDFSLLTQL